jgi:formylglycine-generating enzyme required for sulfatase activity
VINVSWIDAQRYITWLSKKTGEHYRLLSEAEYEYSARAGTTTRFYWGDDVGTNNPDSTTPVGSLPPNAFGLYDMTGNVLQWVEDCSGYDQTGYDGAPTTGDVWFNSACNGRRRRGCSFHYKSDTCRAAWRPLARPNDERSDDTGFRVARDLQ